MGRLALALGYLITGDERYLHEYHASSKYPVVQPQQTVLDTKSLRMLSKLATPPKPSKSKKGSK